MKKDYDMIWSAIIIFGFFAIFCCAALSDADTHVENMRIDNIVMIKSHPKTHGRWACWEIWHEKDNILIMTKVRKPPIDHMSITITKNKSFVDIQKIINYHGIATATKSSKFFLKSMDIYK